MLRVAVALLLAAAALAAVDLSGLVDVVYNKSSFLERLAPTYVFEVDGCRVLVYVVNSPLNMYDEVRYPRNTTVRLLTSAEVEKLLDALFQALGPSAKAEVAIETKNTKEYRELQVKARNASQLAEEARRAVGAGLYLGAADAQEALEKGARQAAYLRLVEWWRRDLAVIFTQSYSLARLEVMAVNFSSAVEALEKAREAAGEVWNSVRVRLWYGPYLVPDDTRSALTKAALTLEGELGRPDGVILVFSVGNVGPLYVMAPYPNGTAPDRAVAERFVRRFVELSGFCKSPLAVEFLPNTVYNPVVVVSPTEYSPPPQPNATTIETAAAVIVAAVVVAVVLLVLARQRK